MILCDACCVVMNPDESASDYVTWKLDGVIYQFCKDCDKKFRKELTLFIKGTKKTNRFEGFCEAKWL